ncbi:MAG: pilus assembly protein PilY [Burkholderiaceae bacterium]|nr:pilus assembly protein PilY [Burkholderiaceae bacterium]
MSRCDLNLRPRGRAAGALPRPPAAWLLALLCAALPAGPAVGAAVEVAQSPLGQAVLPKPNVMFVLDDSNSMLSEFMPDEMSSSNAVGYYSAQCNGVAFDPAVTYAPPVAADGSSFPNASFNAAWDNGYLPGGGTTNLENRFYFTYSGSQPRMNWTYASWGSVIVNTFYNECIAALNAAPATFTRVTLTAASDAALKQNYANWYSYYRTRQLTMRTAAGLAMKPVGDAFRVGFTVISDTGVAGSKFLDVADFTGGVGANQRTRFYDLLYGVPTVGYTPLRDTLSRVGRYYARRMPGQTYDPMQYSCQRNYTLLSTDGYWNSDVSVVKLDGSAIGNEDGAEAPPMRDALGAVASLADVAQYYWATDLRPDLANDVPVTAKDGATHQHMNLFTLGLGVKGTLAYPGSWAALQAGTLDWPVPSGTLPPNGPGYSTWGNATHVDDLWHAAVNGRGDYFSAGNPASLAAAITETFRSISEDTSSGAGSASSSQTPVSGDDWFFVPSFTSVQWSGDVRAYRYTIRSDGTLALPDTRATPLWSAADRLTAQTSRTIYFNGNGSLAAFTYTNLANAQLAAHFDNRCTTASQLLTQCIGTGGLSAAAAAQATGANLVAYLAGSRTLEMSAALPDNRVFRSRSRLLGDLVNAAPVYAGRPPFGYGDAGYASYAAEKANRTKVLYVAANDGMLHAFKVDTAANGGGTELWAFVPTAVMPELWRLADAGYAANHRYFVDATPVVADVYDSRPEFLRWRTILVGGLGAGGRSYYALDVTDPAAPQLLWEFGQTGAVGSTFGRFVAESNQGLALGNPVITKNAAGRWVVAFSSGVNNVSPGDGVGRLFMLDAMTGAKLTELSTGVGDASTPSNLMRLNAWIASDSDNTALRLYGGDLLGHLWRFDPDDRVAPTGAEARLIGLARAADGTTPQPITTRPLLTEVRSGSTRVPVVAFGTGRFLGSGDLGDSTLQTVYAVKDSLADLGSAGLGVLRAAGANLVEQTLGADRLIANPAAVDWSSRNGWFVDLDRAAGERIVIDGVVLSNGKIAFGSTLPGSNMCSAGGSSYLYTFDLGNGGVLDVRSYGSLIVGLGRVSDSAGVSALVTLQRGQDLPPPPAGGISSDLVAKRSSWRELVD